MARIPLGHLNILQTATPDPKSGGLFIAEDLPAATGKSSERRLYMPSHQIAFFKRFGRYRQFLNHWVIARDVAQNC